MGRLLVGWLLSTVAFGSVLFGVLSLAEHRVRVEERAEVQRKRAFRDVSGEELLSPAFEEVLGEFAAHGYPRPRLKLNETGKYRIITFGIDTSLTEFGSFEYDEGTGRLLCTTGPFATDVFGFVETEGKLTLLHLESHDRMIRDPLVRRRGPNDQREDFVDPLSLPVSRPR